MLKIFTTNTQNIFVAASRADPLYLERKIGHALALFQKQQF